MELSIKIIADIIMILCFGMAFLCFKIVPTKRHILKLANDKHIKLTILGSMFFAAGAIIGLIHLTVELIRLA